MTNHPNKNTKPGTKLRVLEEAIRRDYFKGDEYCFFEKASDIDINGAFTTCYVHGANGGRYCFYYTRLEVVEESVFLVKLSSIEFDVVLRHGTVFYNEEDAIAKAQHLQSLHDRKDHWEVYEVKLIGHAERVDVPTTKFVRKA